MNKPERRKYLYNDISNMITQIPLSEKVNTSCLARLFDNKSESYKLFWFKAIMHEVAEGNDSISFKTLIMRMIVDAWYMVSEYKLNLGPADTLEKTVLYISDNNDFLPTEKEDVLIDYLSNSHDKKLHEYMLTLSKNVPYRLQAPLIANPGDRIWYKKSEIIDYINAQTGVMYTICNATALDSKIMITHEWMDYLYSNLGIIQGWVDYNLVTYLQRRNPTVPGISNKIYPPVERNLTTVSKYWKYLIQRERILDVYTGEGLTSNGVSIDHFIPWSYVASDELWNLVPTLKSVNSSKSNNLPEWNAYFARLAKVEYDAYVMVNNDDKAGKLFDKCARENLNSDEIKYTLYKPGQTEKHFADKLSEIMRPVYESAKNLGFREWVYRQ